IRFIPGNWQTVLTTFGIQSLSIPVQPFLPNWQVRDCIQNAKALDNPSKNLKSRFVQAWQGGHTDVKFSRTRVWILQILSGKSNCPRNVMMPRVTIPWYRGLFARIVIADAPLYELARGDTVEPLTIVLSR